MKHSALNCQGKYKRSKKSCHGTHQSINCEELVGGCTKLAAIRTIKVVKSSSSHILTEK